MLPVFSSSFFDYNVNSFIGHSKPVLKTPKEPKTIESKDRSPVSISIGDNVTTFANTSITITCPTTGIPKPVVTWTKDGREISVGERYTVQNDGSLLISEADEEDDARYTCTADSVAGKDSATSVVKVVGELLKTSTAIFLTLFCCWLICQVRLAFWPFQYSVFQATVAFIVLPVELYIDPVLQDIFYSL